MRPGLRPWVECCAYGEPPCKGRLAGAPRRCALPCRGDPARAGTTRSPLVCAAVPVRGHPPSPPAMTYAWPWTCHRGRAVCQTLPPAPSGWVWAHQAPSTMMPCPSGPLSPAHTAQRGYGAVATRRMPVWAGAAAPPRPTSAQTGAVGFPSHAGWCRGQASDGQGRQARHASRPRAL